MSKTTKTETQARLAKEEAERASKMAGQKAARLAKEKSKPVTKLPLAEGAGDDDLAGHAAAIRTFSKHIIEDIIEIGRHLTKAKAIVGHGNFGSWINQEFGWSATTALNFMRVYELSLSNPQRVVDLDLPMSALYLLAAPSTPEEARTEIIDRAAAGEPVSSDEVKETIARAKQEKDGENVNAKPEPDQIKLLKALRKRAENLGFGYLVGQRDNGEFYLTDKTNNDKINCGDSLDEVARQLDIIESAQPARGTGSAERDIDAVKAAGAALAGEFPTPAAATETSSNGHAANTESDADNATSAAKSSAINAADIALDGFTAHVLDLLRRIAKHPAKRFAGTAVKADELLKLGAFFTELGNLKSGDVAPSASKETVH
jgi:hypothetical protein